jgi:hypothetical protein
LFAKKVICEEEGCSIRTTNNLQKRGQWRRTNKFVKKVVCEEGSSSRGRLFARRRRFARKKDVCDEEDEEEEEGEESIEFIESTESTESLGSSLADRLG